jgi:hypothetical protein
MALNTDYGRPIKLFFIKIKNIAGLASKTTKTSQSSNYNFIWEGLFFITAVLEHKTTRLENGEKMRYHTKQSHSNKVLQ